MDIASRTKSGWALLSVFGLALLGTACASVGQDELDSRLDQMRQEMEAGDQQNSEQIDQLDSQLSDMESRLNALEQDLQSLQADFDVTVERMESAIRFSAPVHFAFDEAQVRQQDHEVLDRFSSVLSQYYDQTTVTVEGFTDPAGSAEYNQQLGQRRADAVKTYLSENTAIPGDRIRAVSYGESQDRLVDPDAAGPGEEGMKNRRVVIVVDFVGATGGQEVAETGGTTGL